LGSNKKGYQSYQIFSIYFIIIKWNDVIICYNFKYQRELFKLFVN
jgi:hypothetical protein